MSVDARGGLWLDNPLLVLGLLSLLWVLIASLHTDLWLRWHGNARQLGQLLLKRFGWIRVVLQRASQVRVIDQLAEQWRQADRVTEVVGVAPPGQGRARFQRHGDDPRRSTLAQLLADERKCQARADHRGPRSGVGGQRSGRVPH